MKKLMTMAFLTFCMSGVYGQAFEKDANYITLGYGLDPWGHPGIGNAYGTYKKTSLGPIMLTYERGITDVLGIGRIGVGGGIAQSFYTQKYAWGSIVDVYRRSRTSIIARAAYHFDLPVKGLDLYAGVGAALHIYTDTDKYYDPFSPNAESDGYVVRKSSNIGAGHYVFGGVRYFFSDSFGVYAEAGHGLSALSAGVVFGF